MLVRACRCHALAYHRRSVRHSADNLHRLAKLLRQPGERLSRRNRNDNLILRHLIFNPCDNIRIELRFHGQDDNFCIFYNFFIVSRHMDSELLFRPLPARREHIRPDNLICLKKPFVNYAAHNRGRHVSSSDKS